MFNRILRFLPIIVPIAMRVMRSRRAGTTTGRASTGRSSSGRASTGRRR